MCVPIFLCALLVLCEAGGSEEGKRLIFAVGFFVGICLLFDILLAIGFVCGHLLLLVVFLSIFELLPQWE
jgi:hypothetical protein